MGMSLDWSAASRVHSHGGSNPGPAMSQLIIFAHYLIVTSPGRPLLTLTNLSGDEKSIQDVFILSLIGTS